MPRKTDQLQVRVTPEEKRALRARARRAGQDLSSYILSRVLPDASARFHELVAAVTLPEERRFALAELNDLLAALPRRAFNDAVAFADLDQLGPLDCNYVAAMVEHAAASKGCTPPSWTRSVEPLDRPYFATTLASLRLHLLRRSPVAFKRRNLFVDSTVGDRA